MQSAHCLFRVAFYLCESSRESVQVWPWKSATCRGGVKVTQEMIIHSDTSSYAAFLGSVAHFCSIKRLQKFDFSSGKHLAEPLNWQDCSGPLHVSLLLVRVFWLCLPAAEFPFSPAEADNEGTLTVWRANADSWGTLNVAGENTNCCAASVKAAHSKLHLQAECSPWKSKRVVLYHTQICFWVSAEPFPVRSQFNLNSFFQLYPLLTGNTQE